MGIIPFMRAVSGGAPLTTVGIAVSYAENDNCVVHYKAAIDKANAHELEGKKIAVPFGTVTHYKLLRTLDFLAVDTGKLDLVDMVSVKGAEALARGEVTMACGWGGALRRMLGKNRVLMSAREQTKIGIRTFDVVAVSNDFAEAHPDLVTAFLKVSDRAADYLDDHPDEAGPVIAEAAGPESQGVQHPSLAVPVLHPRRPVDRNLDAGRGCRRSPGRWRTSMLSRAPCPRRSTTTGRCSTPASMNGSGKRPVF